MNVTCHRKVSLCARHSSQNLTDWLHLRHSSPKEHCRITVTTYDEEAETGSVTGPRSHKE